MWVKAVSNDIVFAVRQALSKYGTRVKIVLETALEIAKSNRLRGSDRLGDFDFKSLVESLRAKGFYYNPSQLLRILEREYGIVETSYRSSNQHWYRFRDLEAVEKALSLRSEEVIPYPGGTLLDPDVVLLRIQIRSLRPMEMLNFLKNLLMKPRITSRDAEKFERFAFTKLPKVVKLLKQAEDYEDALAAELKVLREVVELAYEVAERVAKVDLELGLGSAVMSVDVAQRL